MAYRSSTGDLAAYDDDRRPQPARWDRNKFERYSRGGGGVPPPGMPAERNTFHFEEHDRYGPRGEHHDINIEVDDRYGRSRAPPQPRARYVDDLDDHRGFRRRPTDFLDEPLSPEASNRALAPYRPAPDYGAPNYGTPGRRPSRPSYIRRQSSLDTFDRKPYPRYGDRYVDYEREEFRGSPAGYSQALAIPSRRRSGRRAGPAYEEEWEEVRYRDDDEPSLYEEDYRDIRIRRKRSRRRPHRSRSSSVSSRTSDTTARTGTTAKTSRSRKSSVSRKTKKSSKSTKSRRSRSEARAQEQTRSSSSSSSSSATSVTSNLPGKRGRTKMPKRLVHKDAIAKHGYPYDEEGDFFMIRRALTKEQIDEVIKSSEEYKDKLTTYRYESTTDVEQVAPPPPESVHSSNTNYRSHRRAQSRSRSRRRRSHSHDSIGSGTTITVGHHHDNHGSYGGGGSTPYNTIVSPPPHSGYHTQTVQPPPMGRPRSGSRNVYHEHFEESERIAGPLTVLTPAQQQHRRETEIREEMRSLQIERQSLRSERDRSEYDVDIVIGPKEPVRDVVRVEKDRKAKPNPKALALLMSTLS